MKKTKQKFCYCGSKLNFNSHIRHINTQTHNFRIQYLLGLQKELDHLLQQRSYLYRKIQRTTNKLESLSSSHLEIIENAFDINLFLTKTLGYKTLPKESDTCLFCLLPATNYICQTCLTEIESQPNQSAKKDKELSLILQRQHYKEYNDYLQKKLPKYDYEISKIRTKITNYINQCRTNKSLMEFI